ncbi:peptidoglycan bridge formation glycyltransferase FemA/FemB family protein [Candidatus Falkowbacteria bacterium]|uniref:N-acetyltransferase domain-containing protein n=1 Tax=Candidatus Falkowbacteria bacterium CG10_big_fil_rev_8_21_14_0_10_37_18 TaxID=1974562 RepID=A0A2H0V9J9_9BACT|nr:peptidoglycan bridge formation glycyltransferase FemA/FemB family protein [Candidatus Falkowbacteria bacterium]NCQ12873.1 peptidoglycan bridge formation glycyltransferase FemA/FemB family protein [Candidatus Falkowbacteria bacterium]PIR95768.1 MAG: hypothetical protein COT93_00540 [Candidatus Falkowbacteria bacterium CG10_big_fil_rev_8_21_14_0_10_37_18]
MELFYFSDSKQLDDFIKASVLQGGAEFLQSWEWGDILAKDGQEILRLGVRSKAKQKILAAATLVKKSSAGVSYYYAARGPIIAKDLNRELYQEVINFLFSEIKKINPSLLFLRIEPRESLEAGTHFKIKKSLDLNPRQTLFLDLTKSVEELRAEMQSKTRYNLRLAEKKGVTVREGSLDDFPQFWRLMNLTGERDNFRLHQAKHYHNLLQTDPAVIKLFLAEHQGRIIAAGIFSFWGDKAVYMHGASDNEFRNTMATYLLQWTAIITAQKLGLKYYDWHGIDAKKWPGVTRFKLGFGGYPVEYTGTWDVVFRPVFYMFYGILRRLRRLIR